MHGTSFMLNSDNKDKIAQSSFTHTSLKGHKIMIGSCVKLYQASSGIYPEFKTGFHSLLNNQAVFPLTSFFVFPSARSFTV